MDDSLASKPNKVTGNRCKNLELMGFIEGDVNNDGHPKKLPMANVSRGKEDRQY